MVVETCVVVPLMVWLLFSIIQYSVIFNTLATLNNISRDCARYGGAMVNSSGFNGGTTSTASSSSIQDYLQQECQATNGVINYSDLPKCANGAEQPCIYQDSTSTPFSAEPATISGTQDHEFIAVITYPISKKIYVNGLVPGLSAFEAGPISVQSAFMIQPPATGGSSS